MTSIGRGIRLVAVGAALALTAGLVSATPASAADPNLLTDQFDAVGSSYIGSIKATLPITATTLTETIDLANDAHPNSFDIVDGNLPIASQQITFKALGLIPVRATATLTEKTPITGVLNADPDSGNLTLNANVSYSIKLTNVSAQIFGIWTPLFVGNNCQTVSPAKINVQTPAGQGFDVVTGGPLVGKYSIGLFAGCTAFFIPGLGSLTINALVPGSNNTINLALSNGRFAG